MSVIGKGSAVDTMPDEQGSVTLHFTRNLSFSSSFSDWAQNTNELHFFPVSPQIPAGNNHSYKIWSIKVHKFR